MFLACDLANRIAEILYQGSSNVNSSFDINLLINKYSSFSNNLHIKTYLLSFKFVKTLNFY